ncbi:Fuseless [uncultured archaeon]|nr:Fuseless [uncultured archaeon]
MADLRPLTAMVIVTAVIAFWRGLWGLMDLYLFPNEPVVSYLFSILIGLVILGVTNYLVKEFI